MYSWSDKYFKDIAVNRTCSLNVKSHEETSKYCLMESTLSKHINNLKDMKVHVRHI